MKEASLMKGDMPPLSPTSSSSSPCSKVTPPPSLSLCFLLSSTCYIIQLYFATNIISLHCLSIDLTNGGREMDLLLLVVVVFLVGDDVNMINCFVVRVVD